MIKIALFDIDYTLIRFDSFFKFITALLKNTPLKLFKLPGLLLHSIPVILKIKDLTSYKQRWLSLTDDLSDKELDNISKVFVTSVVIPGIKKGVTSDIEKYKALGYSIVFATASFEFYLKYLAEYFNADHFFGTKIDKINNKRVISGVNCKGIEKIKRILEVIPENEINTDESISFSDSMSDYPYKQITGIFSIVEKKNWVIKKNFT